MALFSKERDEARAALVVAESALANMTAERDTAIENLKEVTGQREYAIKLGEELEVKLEESTKAVAALEVEKLKIQKELETFKADFETKLNAAVIDRCAAAGVSPVANDPAAGADSGKTMKRAEFNKLSASEKAQFCRSGGKLTD